MSFKREGDDPAQLGVLQKRRVADLLANYIPEDEALLLRSGRYACTVCAHRPVFDTLDVLTVHRAGKKHMGSKLGGLAASGGAAPSERVPPSSPSLSSRPAAFLREEALTPGRGPEAAARGGGAGRGGRRAGLPGPSSGSDEEDCPERSAESGSLQQLLPQDGGGGKQLASWRDPDGAECRPDAAGAVAEGRRSRGGQPCSPAARAPRRASGRTKGGSGPDTARWQRKSLIVGPEPGRSPQPREAPGPGAIPAAAERWLDPGPLRQVGEGRER